MIKNDTKIDPVLETLATLHVGRNGIEIKTHSMMNDGTEHWVVISRGIERYVTELTLDQHQPMRVDRIAVSIGRFVTFIPWKKQSQASSSFSPMYAPVPIDEITHGVRMVDDLCYPVWKFVARIQRHYSELRELDGAIAWRKLLSRFKRANFLEDAARGDRKNGWADGNKTRFQHCVGSQGCGLFKVILEESESIQKAPKQRRNFSRMDLIHFSRLFAV